jgi:hypothetical protein
MCAELWRTFDVYVEDAARMGHRSALTRVEARWLLHPSRCDDELGRLSNCLVEVGAGPDDSGNIWLV